MKALAVFLLGLLVAGAFANQASADPGHGYIEVCKAANSSLNGTFEFSVSNGGSTVWLAQGACSEPMAVEHGSVTVTELGGSLGIGQDGTTLSPDTSYLSASASAIGPSGIVPGTPSLGGFAYTVTVPIGTASAVTIVTFADQIVTGQIEVCKAVVPNEGLSGSWQFTVTGANSVSQTVTVPAGQCSAAITVPAGRVLVQETGDLSEAVTAITAVDGNVGVSQIVGPLSPGPSGQPNLSKAEVVANVAPGDMSQGTIITMTNSGVFLKLCKKVDGGLTPPSGPYQFTLTSSGNAGPIAVPGTEALTATAAQNPVCSLDVGPLRAGTSVSIAESLAPGTKVGSITTNVTTDPYTGKTSVVSASSLPNGTITVVLGKGETVVTYENVPADPGTLKVCKLSGTPSVSGTYTFDLSPSGLAADGTTVVSKVQAQVGSCSAPVTYPYGTKVTVTEEAVAGSTLATVAGDPVSVQVVESGVATNTSMSTVSGVNTAARSAVVTVSEGGPGGVITEATFTNHDDPGSSSGGSVSSGGTTGSSSSSSSVVNAGVSPVLVTPVLSVASGSNVVSHASAAKLLKLQTQLATLKAKVHKLSMKRAAAKSVVAKKGFTKQILALQAQERKLSASIKLLK